MCVSDGPLSLLPHCSPWALRPPHSEAARQSQCSTSLWTSVLPGYRIQSWSVFLAEVSFLQMNTAAAYRVHWPGSPAMFEARTGWVLNFSAPSRLSHLGPEGFCIVLGSSRAEWGAPVPDVRGTDISLSPAPLPCRPLGIGNPTYKARPLGRLYLLTPVGGPPPVQALSTFSPTLWG